MERKKIYLTPTMNLVLTNKFAENMGEMDDDEKKKNNRRKIMRDVLAGKRENASDSFLSMAYGCRQLASIGSCLGQ